MAGAESAIVFLPRSTTLVAGGSPWVDYCSAPLDTSRWSSAPFQVRRGESENTTFTIWFEESLDCDKWVLGAATPVGYVIGPDETRLFSYGFRLRWFRVRVQVTNTLSSAAPVTCWAVGDFTVRERARSEG